ncbi:hypothetical protein [Hyperthermus butylicus]|uniref:Uncharacterized protein n=1 Tax=Hyperthermus butylicus (strain DSM 5456 / JCM 9403 / PLM1-5) TaxID=415426 RepID=A2BJK3_HYPBU|nr:hypothetical protein [Hyperthermus butylicus]ABM80164.1 hypothetical protein Hbut_0292 [Hyperthermus butylicus DSM 5456]
MLGLARVRLELLMATILIVIGVVVVVAGALAAYHAYAMYNPVLPPAERLDQAIAYTSYELVNLAARLGFLGLMIWAGSVLLLRGIELLQTLRREGKG